MVSSLAEGQMFWTGGYRDPGGVRPWTGMWKWTDGSAFSYTNWRNTEPNDRCNRKEFYIEMTNGRWNDLADWRLRPFVCKVIKPIMS